MCLASSAHPHKLKVVIDCSEVEYHATDQLVLAVATAKMQRRCSVYALESSSYLARMCKG